MDKTQVKQLRQSSPITYISNYTIFKCNQNVYPFIWHWDVVAVFFLFWFDKLRQQAQDGIYPNEINATVSHDIS